MFGFLRIIVRFGLAQIVKRVKNIKQKMFKNLFKKTKCFTFEV